MPRIILVKAGHALVRQVFSPPLGILSLAAFLRDRRPDLELKLIPMLPGELEISAVVKKILAAAPDLVGLSAMSLESKELHALAQGLKAQRPDLPVIAGGPYPSTAPDLALKDPNLDFIVRGEGEQTLLELLPRALAGEKTAEEVQGVGFRKNHEPVLTPPREKFVDLDSLPLPAYDLIDLPRYWDQPRFGTTSARREYATLSTSRACPYRCSYCHRLFGPRYRSQSPEVVLRDLTALSEKFGVREIQFVDDCFNLEKKRVAGICAGIRERGLDFAVSFPNGVRGDIMDTATLDHLKSAGTYRITYAVETASPRLQDFLNKNLNLAKVKQIIAETDARDILVDGFFMLGFPGETRAEIEATLRFALESKLHSANFFFVTPFPGTELHARAKSMGYQVQERIDAFHYFDPLTNLSEISSEELNRRVRNTFLRFYLNPWRLWRIAKLFPNKKQLPALLLHFIKISLKKI